MTREEMIEQLEKQNGKDWLAERESDIPILEEVIKAMQPEPCEDAISRQAVLDEISEVCFSRSQEWIEFRINHGSNGERDLIINYIKHLPSVQPKQKWIPVSERLPEEFESVLVCYKSQGGMAQCVSEKLVNMDGSNRWSAIYGQEPIAWMPLPEPYKAESEGKE